MENTVYIKQIQGHADHGWLQANFSFSFGSWYNPDRIQFGALRVLNDDWRRNGFWTLTTIWKSSQSL
jgi:redox-sensitive bicupin YhaK (pirin superfamily)